MTQEHLRTSHADERLQSYPSDRWVPWAIIVFAVLLWANNFGPLWLQLLFAVLGFVCGISVIWTTGRDLYAKLRNWEQEKD